MYIKVHIQYHRREEENNRILKALFVWESGFEMMDLKGIECIVCGWEGCLD